MGRVDIGIADCLAGAHHGVDHLPGARGREAPVGGEADHQEGALRRGQGPGQVALVGRGRVEVVQGRSEERRVGKECRSRWSPYDEKKKSEERTDGTGVWKTVGRVRMRRG